MDGREQSTLRQSTLMGRWDTLPLLGSHIPDMARVHRKRKCARTLDCKKDKMGEGPRDCSASGSVGFGPIWVRCFTRCYKIANMGTKNRICPEYCLSVVLFPYPRSSATPAVSPSFCPPSPSPSPSLPTNLRLLCTPNAGSAYNQGEEGWRGLCVYLTFSLPSCH